MVKGLNEESRLSHSNVGPFFVHFASIHPHPRFHSLFRSEIDICSPCFRNQGFLSRFIEFISICLKTYTMSDFAVRYIHTQILGGLCVHMCACVQPSFSAHGGIVFRISKNTKICRCLSPFYKMVQYLHVTYTIFLCI